jgi:tetratricopeptide (TPR) repeat protein
VIAQPESRSSGWRRWFRTLPRTSVLGICVALLAALQGIFALLEVKVWIRVIATVIVFAVAVASEADKLHTKRAEKAASEARAADEARTAEQEWQRRVARVLRWWPPALLADVDPYELGVCYSGKADTFRQDEAWLPPYVPRDIHQQARERMRARGMLLVIGQVGSGMTRTAFEIAGGDETARVTLAPRVSDGLSVAVDQYDVLSRIDRRPPLLVWLDRIDQLPDLSHDVLRKCLGHAVGSRVVATISASAYAVWSVEHRELAEMFEQVTLDRLASERELELAAAVYPGVDFTEGIAATFTTTGSLLRRMRTGYQDCPYEAVGSDCPLARPIVETVFAWTNTGTTRAMPMTLVTRALLQRPGLAQYVDSAHMTAALQWATGHTIEHAALLFQDDTCAPGQKNDALAGVQPPESATASACVRAHPHVAIIWEPSTAPSAAVWTAAITEAFSAGDSENGGRIGFTAQALRSLEAANQAWSQITTLEDPAVAWVERAAVFSEHAHDYRGARLAFEHLLRLQETALGADHPAVAATLGSLGNAWFDLGDHARARDLYQRALTIQEREYGTDHPDVAATLGGLGITWSHLDPARARDLHQRALTIQEREYGTDHPDVATTLSNLGNAWHKLGDPAQARDLHQRALNINEREYGPQHPQVATTLSNLGTTWLDLGDPAQARDLHQRALTIRERAYGPRHLKVAATLNNLGNAWLNLGDPQRARDLYQRALAIREREYGPDHPEVATTLSNLGNAWYDLGDPAQARDLHQRALTIREREYGPDHPEVAMTLVNLGNAWYALADPAQARDLHQRALTIKERAYGPDHPQLIIAMIGLGDDWLAVGHPAKASDLYQRVLRITNTHFPNGHPLQEDIRARLRAVDPDLIILADGSTVTRLEAPPNTSTGSVSDGLQE